MRPRFKPVDQITDDDCYRACVASLLGLPASEVPHFTEVAMRLAPNVGHTAAWIGANRWLEQHSLALVYVRVERGALMIPKGAYCIAHGDSPRGVGHSVIWDNAGDGLAHDPHPSRAGIVGEPDGMELLVELAP
jgi:hypothetical protein